MEDPDRTGNLRFYFREDGCFFQARNTRLWLTGVGQFNSDDPADHWSTPFPATPVRCLTESQRAELAEAIRQADFGSLRGTYSSSRKQTPPTVERWTAVQSGAPKSAVVENEEAPATLVKLRETVDRLVAQAPLVKP